MEVYENDKYAVMAGGLYIRMNNYYMNTYILYQMNKYNVVIAQGLIAAVIN